MADLIIDRLIDLAATRSDSVAYVFLQEGEPADRLTFGQLAGRVSAVARHLLAEASAGDPVGLVFAPGLDPLVALLACLRLGLAAVLIPPPTGEAARKRYEAILKDCRPSRILSNAQTVGRLRRGPDNSGRGPRWLLIDTVPVDPDGTVPLGDLGLGPLPVLEDLAIIQYTSGSSAEPKGVMISHRNIAATRTCIDAGCATGPGDRWLSWLPLEHDLGLFGGALQSLWHGAINHLMAPLSFWRRPLSWPMAVGRYGITISGGPDFAFARCADAVRGRDVAAALGGHRLDRWEIAFCGAEPVRADTYRRFADAFGSIGFNERAYCPCYGLAEATLLVSGGSRYDPPPLLSRPATGDAAHPPPGRHGTVVSCGPVRTSGGGMIVDPETLHPLAPGMDGEIWVAGDSVGQGYWGRPAASDAAFRARTALGDGPFLRTGDLGFVSDGELYVTGRLKDLVILQGRNIHPADLEHSARMTAEADRLGTIVVANQSDAGGGDQGLILVAEVPGRHRHIVERGAGRLATALWRAVLRRHGVSVDRIALVPTGTVMVTTSGKVRRRATVDRVAADPALLLHDWRDAARIAAKAPERAAAVADLCGLMPTPRRSEIALFARRWMMAALEADADELDDGMSWADAGLTSAAAVEFVADIERATGVALSADLLFEHPTFGSLLPRLEAALCP